MIYIFALLAALLVTGEVHAYKDVTLMEPFPNGQGTVEGNDAISLMKSYAQMVVSYLVGLTMLAAVLWIAYGGLQIILKAREGSSGGIGDGKEYIEKALTGVVIIVLAGVILYMANPTFFTG